MARPKAEVMAEERKEDARARILEALQTRGTSVVGTWSEIKAELGLDDIPVRLFRGSCWHLKAGDRDPEGKSRIRVTRHDDAEHASMLAPEFVVKSL